MKLFDKTLDDVTNEYRYLCSEDGTFMVRNEKTLKWELFDKNKNLIDFDPFRNDLAERNGYSINYSE